MKSSVKLGDRDVRGIGSMVVEFVARRERGSEVWT